MIVEPDFPDHWKVEFVVAAIGEAGVRCVLRLWAHCQSRRTDTFSDMPAEVLAAVCRFTGDAKKLDRALRSVRLIERDGRGIVVVGWRERNAGLLASIENGKKGGRPKTRSQVSGRLTQREPNGNPQVSTGLTQPEPARNRVEESRLDIPPSVPQGGQSSGAETGSSDPSPDSAKKEKGAGGDEGRETRDEGGTAAILDDAKVRICRMFGRQRVFLGRDAERDLFESLQAGVLPLATEDWQLLEWRFSLPKEEKDSDLRARRQHAESLASNLASELDRARGYAKKAGGGPAPVITTVEPEGWREEFAARWPHASVPVSFDQAPDYIRDELRDWAKKRAGVVA